MSQSVLGPLGSGVQQASLKGSHPGTLQRLTSSGSFTAPIILPSDRPGFEKPRTHPTAGSSGTWPHSATADRSPLGHQQTSIPTLAAQTERSAPMYSAIPLPYDSGSQGVVQSADEYQDWASNPALYQLQYAASHPQTYFAESWNTQAHLEQLSQAHLQQQQQHQPQQHHYQQSQPQPQPTALHIQTSQTHQNHYNFVPDPYHPPAEQTNYDFSNATTSLDPSRRVRGSTRAHQPQTAVPSAAFTFGSQIQGSDPSGMSQPSQVQEEQARLTNGNYFGARGQPTSQAPAESQPQVTYTFSHYHPATTPSSDATNLSSHSPRSWTGQDDTSYHGDLSSSGANPSLASTSLQPSPSAPSQTLSPDSPTTSRGSGHPNKRRQIEREDVSEDDEPRSSFPMTMVMQGPPTMIGPYSTTSRLPGACKHCKRLKMRCEFPDGENTCKRCKSTGHQCIVEGRKPRNAPNKREYLLAQIRQKDAMIEKLLRELHDPYQATPLAVAAFRANTSPSDRNKESVIEWLERMESNVQHSGARGQTWAELRDGDDENSGDEDVDGGAGEGTERGSVLGRTPDTGETSADARDQLHTLAENAVPIGLLADMSLDNKPKKTKKASSPQGVNDDENEDFGVANETYFQPGPAYNLDIRASLIESHSPPEILLHGLVTPHDVEELFKIFYNRLNVHVTLLDRDVHTPAMTFKRCPFLFTVVCAVASRYYDVKSEIYPIAMHFAKKAAADGLLHGWKSIELAQAYILLSIYGQPARKWEEDRSWLYIGLAIRIATDLNLHQISTVKPKSDAHQREIINKTRLWMNCYNLDRSMATQFGKPATIRENYTIRHSEDWYKKSPFNHPYDVGLCAYTQMLRIMGRFHEEIYSDPDAPTGLNQAKDFREVIMRHDADMTRYYEEWTRRFQEDSDLTEPAYVFRSSLLPFLTNYSRLVMYSFGFQQAFKRGMQPGDKFLLEKCFEAAKSVILCMVEQLSPEYMRYSPDGHFNFASFASAFLLKLLRPEFLTLSLLTLEQEQEIFDLIGRLVAFLNSREVAMDDRHTPRLHARFLHSLLKKYRKEAAARGRLNSHGPPARTQGQATGGTQGAVDGVQYAQQQPAPSAPGSAPDQLMYSVSPPQSVYRGAQGAPAAEAMAGGVGPAQGYAEDMGFGMDLTAMDFESTGEIPGSLLAVSNDSWYKDFLMPGHVWPESPPTTSGTDYYNGSGYHPTAQVSQRAGV